MPRQQRLAPRSCSTRPAPAPAAAALTRRRLTQQQQQQRLAAVSDKEPGAASASQQQQQQPSVDADEEARIEALEASLSKAKPKGGPRRQIPIRNMTPRQEVDSGNMADWKEGKLFPEGWEEMPLDQKVAELYMGKRGALFW